MALIPSDLERSLDSLHIEVRRAELVTSEWESGGESDPGPVGGLAVELIRYLTGEAADLLGLARPVVEAGDHVAAAHVEERVGPIIAALVGLIREEVPSLESVEQLHRSMVRFVDSVRQALRKLSAEGSHDEATEFLGHLRHVHQELAEIERSLGVRKAVLLTEQAAKGVKAAREASEAAAGVGTAEMSLHYMEIADKELEHADRFRVLAIVLWVISLGAAATVFWLSLTLTDDVWWIQLTRFLAVVPFVLFSAYASHEANHHRKVGRRAREYQTRLKTLEAFIQTLPTDGQNELRLEVGRAVLTGPASLGEGADPVVLDPQVLTDKLLDVLGRGKSDG